MPSSIQHWQKGFQKLHLNNHISVAPAIPRLLVLQEKLLVQTSFRRSLLGSSMRVKSAPSSRGRSPRRCCFNYNQLLATHPPTHLHCKFPPGARSRNAVSDVTGSAFRFDQFLLLSMVSQQWNSTSLSLFMKFPPMQYKMNPDPALRSPTANLPLYSFLPCARVLPIIRALLQFFSAAPLSLPFSQ